MMGFVTSFAKYVQILMRSQKSIDSLIVAVGFSFGQFIHERLIIKPAIIRAM